jgi:Na+-translocating ferredoxin:NAD+ oxidoreductase RnfG subunit
MPLTKKETRFVKAMFSEGAYPKELYVPAQDTSIRSALRDSDRLYLLRLQDQVSGYLLSTSAMGRYDYFDYLLAFNPDLSVLGLTITTYRSSHGAAICQKKWLSQFKGYSGEELRLGKEIDAVSGATISATSLLKDLRRCYQIMIRLKAEGYILE